VDALPGHANSYLLKGTEASYTLGKDSIHFGPGRLEHKNTQLRGSLPMMDAPSVYLTGFTPFQHKIIIR
jgi:hypothetical protein